MKLNDIVVILINKGVIHKVGEEYFLTSTVNKVLSDINIHDNFTIDERIKPSLHKLYPSSIREVSEEKKIKALLAYCKVPEVFNKNGSSYILHSVDMKSKKIIMGILYDSRYEPEKVLRVVSDYYQNTEYPKTVKTFFSDRDFETLYEMAKEGKNLKSIVKPDNDTMI